MHGGGHSIDGSQSNYKTTSHTEQHHPSQEHSGGRRRGRQASHTPTLCSRPSFIGHEPTLKHDIFDYQETQQAQKYRNNIEALKIYIGRKHTKYTAQLVSSLETLTLSIPEELAILTETSPTPGALKNGNWTTRKGRNNEKHSKIS